MRIHRQQSRRNLKYSVIPNSCTLLLDNMVMNRIIIKRLSRSDGFDGGRLTLILTATMIKDRGSHLP
ncbi:hypothetical protein D3C85_961070 [compost metagenome]